MIVRVQLVDPETGVVVASVEAQPVREARRPGCAVYSHQQLYSMVAGHLAVQAYAKAMSNT